MQINNDNVVAYARQRGLLGATETPRVELLAGGVACVVLRLHAGPRAIVVKQAGERFRVKETWLVDPRRNWLEAQVQTLAREALGPDHVPAVLDIDRDNFAYTMESAPLDAQNWKSALLAGDIDPALGAQCARLLERFRQIDPARLPAEVRDPVFFYQQRIEPYFEFTARRHPDVAPTLLALAKTLAVPEALTYGDFTPKNFLVANGKLILLDYEVVCLGWPEFDVASLVNHLTLKAFHLPAQRIQLREMIRQFLAGLRPRPEWLVCLGALLLARVDGKSPAEYLREEGKPAIRTAAQELLRGRYASYEKFYSATFAAL